MTPERFAQLKLVVLQVVHLPEDEQQSFLDEACEGDPELRREVESLLAHRDKTDAIMEMGASVRLTAPGFLAGMRNMAEARPMVDFGRYRNLRPCGEGGMGVVYRAEDTKLQREVALKFLHPDFAGGEQATARFIHEARAAAALDHPNICTIYEVDEVEGQTFISMAYVKGVTLRERIAAGPLSVKDTLLIGLQIANGLREAHGKGIVHRDIKPSNLMISSNGFVKIMDFGIAWSGDSSDTSETGAAAGTAGYMSPEQTLGAAVDHATDIWALGVVLYEMLTGKLPFPGDTKQAVGNAILHGTARRIESFHGDVPPALDAIIRRCLEKNPSQRPDAAEVARQLETLRQGAGALDEPGVAARVRRRNTLAIAAVGVVFLVIVGSVGLWWAAHRGNGATSPEQRLRRLTAFHQEQLAIGGSALSPDGRYLAVPNHGALDLFSVETGEKRRIDGAYPGRIERVAWTPNGETMLCASANHLWFQSVSTDSSRLLLDGPVDDFVISPDGTQLALIRKTRTVISIMPVSRGGPRIIREASSGDIFFSATWSPTGSRIAYLRAAKGSDGTRVVNLESSDLAGSHIALIENECCIDDGDAWRSLCWLPDGRLVFGRYTDYSHRTSQLEAIKVDEATGQPDGRPQRLLAIEGMRLRQPSASADGHRLSFHREQVVDELLSLQLDASGDSVGVEQLSSSRWPAKAGAWTRDGQSVFFAVENGSGDQNISLRQIESGIEQPFVGTAETEEPLCLTPSGSELVFRQGSFFKRRSLDGGSDMTILGAGPEDRVLCAAAPGSLCVLCSVERENTGREIVFRRLGVSSGEVGEEIGRITVGTQRPPGFEYDLSPDGTRIAVTEQSGRLRLVDLRDGSERELSDDLGRPQYVAWSGDGSWLCVSGMFGGAIYWLKRVPLDGGEPRLLWTSYDYWPSKPRPSPDGTRVAFSRLGQETDVWMLEDP